MESIIFSVFIIFYLYVLFPPLEIGKRLAQGISLFSILTLSFILYDKETKSRQESETAEPIEYKINLLNQTDVEIIT